MGVMKDISELSKYLVHLAPIRFGAGIKGINNYYKKKK
jgi:hypothetical protein